MMKIETISVVVGTTACPSRCPFCIAKMTHNPVPDDYRQSLPMNHEHYNVRLSRALWVASLGRCTTALITGKGEPTLPAFRLNLYDVAFRCADYVPIVELQTSGIYLNELLWDHKGMRVLNTIAISVISTLDSINAGMYYPQHPERYCLRGMIDLCHRYGKSVRLTLMLQHGGVSTPERLDAVVEFCKSAGVEQLTVRNIVIPNSGKSRESVGVRGYVHMNRLTSHELDDIRRYLDDDGDRLMTLSHGAVIYDVRGQNVCFSNCLTIDEKIDTIRSMIVFPDGQVRYSWDYEGAILF